MKNTFGYARVSSADQVLNLQIDALKKAGCSKVFEDVLSSVKADRPGLSAALQYLREGDTLIVWRLDRLGRSLKDLIAIIETLENHGVAFKSLTEGIDTGTSGGRLIFHIFGALAEFERELIRERTFAGLAAARARGRLGGRRQQHSDAIVMAARQDAKTSDKTIDEICKAYKISRGTYYRRLKGK